MSLKNFSQTVTKKSSQDSTKIQLTKPIARLVIKDLIKGDGVKKELDIVVDKTNILKQKIALKDEIITNLNTQINNFNSILSTKSDQLSISRELSKKLQTDLTKQKAKNKVFKLAGGGLLIAIISLSIL